MNKETNRGFFLKSAKEQSYNLPIGTAQTKKTSVSFFLQEKNDPLLLKRETPNRSLLNITKRKNGRVFLENEKNKHEGAYFENEQDQFHGETDSYLENVKESEIGTTLKSAEELLKGKCRNEEFCNILSQSFLSYANFLILNRCLSDYRDGLKKVQRRIIWSMHEINKGSTKGVYKKCARIVGEVIGKYHPHGDKSVYDALVRLAQKHHNNNVLIKGYGNFGTIEFNAAAMRYTEAKISNFCLDVLLNEINDENIEYVKNFDGNEKEPKVFCSKVPLLLVNGCSGIAVSILSNIPCHNLIDVINCTISFLINKDITEEELFHIIKGPDFPTGGVIISKKKVLENLYNSGKGNVMIRSTVFLEYTKNGKTHTVHINDLLALNSSDIEKGNKKLIIKNLPPNVKPNELIVNLVELLNEKKNEHDNILSKIRDESEKEDMRIVLELKKHAQIEQIHNILLFLFKYTPMEINYHCNFVCIGRQNSYTQFSLKSFLNMWCEYRIEFIKKNYIIKNKNLLKELNIINLYLIIQSKIVDIIQFFQKEHNIEKIKTYLQQNFQLNEEQIKYIMSMKIQKLINMKNINFQKNKEQILQKMKSNEEIINNRENIKKIMIEELFHIKNRYGIRKKNTQIPPSQLNYKYIYLNKDNLMQPHWVDTQTSFIKTTATLKRATKNPLEMHPKEEKSFLKEPATTEELTKLKQMKQMPEETENDNKREKTFYYEEYRNTYIDPIETDEQEIYSKEEMLILLTQGGYVKKIKITEKLNNHPNNIIKLANSKYIQKESEENRQRRNGIKIRSTQEEETEKNNNSGNYIENDLDTKEEKENYKKQSLENTNERIDFEHQKNQDDPICSKVLNNNDKEEMNIYKIKKSIFVKNNDKILITDNRNKAFILNVSDIPICSYDSKGVPINQFVKSTKNITGLLKFDAHKKYVVVCNESGKLKIIKNDIFLKKMRKGITLFKNRNANNIYFSYCNSADMCIVGTNSGLIIQFPLNSFKISKKNSTGNKCINLQKNDHVVDLVTYENTERNLKNLKIIFLSKNGLGKMTDVEELKVQKKKGKGYRIMRFRKRKNESKKPGGSVEHEKTKKTDVEKKKEQIKENPMQATDMETDKENGKKDSIKSDELLGFKLYDFSKKRDNDILIMITDHAVLIRKNVSLLKRKNRNQSSHIYAKLNKLNKLIYFDII